MDQRPPIDDPSAPAGPAEAPAAPADDVVAAAAADADVPVAAEAAADVALHRGRTLHDDLAATDVFCPALNSARRGFEPIPLAPPPHDAPRTTDH